MFYYFRNKEFWNKHYVFRRTPIPGTGRKSRYGCWLRKPKTTQERRMYLAHFGQGKMRAKRNFSNLPETWDDICRHHDRSWKNKKFRKQWEKNRL